MEKNVVLRINDKLGEEAYEGSQEVGGAIALDNQFSVISKLPGEEDFLRSMCRYWLWDSFGIDAQIKGVKIDEQNEIDRALGLWPVKFEFTSFDGEEGDGVAFFEE
jgi:hypothetical protein